MTRGQNTEEACLIILPEFCFFLISLICFLHCTTVSNLGQRVIFLLGTLLADLKSYHNMPNNNKNRKIILKHWKRFLHI